MALGIVNMYQIHIHSEVGCKRTPFPRGLNSLLVFLLPHSTTVWLVTVRYPEHLAFCSWSSSLSPLRPLRPGTLPPDSLWATKDSRARIIFNSDCPHYFKHEVLVVRDKLLDLWILKYSLLYAEYCVRVISMFCK